MVMIDMPMKRGRVEMDDSWVSWQGKDQVRDNSITALANCLMLLSGSHQYRVPTTEAEAASGGRVFECKTCNRQFPSFQALGGHRASHKRPKLMAGELGLGLRPNSPPKPKTHECSICGLEFAIGQALGGHMRRHRAVMSSPPHRETGAGAQRPLWLDLNLTPLENDLAAH